jgi:uncharacterized integral membrane protein
MSRLRPALIAFMVAIAAVATVALAYGLHTIGAPLWMILFGPAMLVVIIVMRVMEHRRLRAASQDAPAGN